jgi:homoserine O-acetyltransferase/O-succinyltransferase
MLSLRKFFRGLAIHQYNSNQAFTLESGNTLPGIHISYHTYGHPNKDGSNVIWICHALTANADVADWWAGMVGEGKFIDPAEYYIVCANIIGSCYGSSGPLSENTASTHYFHSFPQVTIRDMVKAHVLLREHLGISKIHLLIGGSMGGYQALEWALLEPEKIDRLCLLSTSAAESAWGIAVHTAQRLAIEADSTWKDASFSAGHKGLKAARAIGMLTYRNYPTFVRTQSDPDKEKTDNFRAASYINYQGDKLVKRFNAQCYWLLTKAMDSHNISRGRTTDLPGTLALLKQPALIIAITSDLLCPPEEQLFLSQHLPHATYHEIDSSYGHDGFLIEFEKIGKILLEWLK